MIAIALAYGLDLSISAFTGAYADATLVAAVPPVGVCSIVALRRVVTDMAMTFHLRLRIAATCDNQIGQSLGVWAHARLLLTVIDAATLMTVIRLIDWGILWVHAVVDEMSKPADMTALASRGSISERSMRTNRQPNESVSPKS